MGVEHSIPHNATELANHIKGAAHSTVIPLSGFILDRVTAWLPSFGVIINDLIEDVCCMPLTTASPHQRFPSFLEVQHGFSVHAIALDKLSQ